MNIKKPGRIFIGSSLFFLFLMGLSIFIFPEEKKENQVVKLSNDQIIFSVVFKDKMLMSDQLERKKPGGNPENGSGCLLETDADFGLEFMWTGWRAPEKKNNANNPVLFSKKDFQLVEFQKQKGLNEAQELKLLLRGKNNPFEILITYHMKKGSFYIKKKLAVRDQKSEFHFLQWIWPCSGFVYGDFKILNKGGFGQPLAFCSKKSGMFFGLEYPASINRLISRDKNKLRISCGQEIGEQINKEWFESEWVVRALTPASQVKSWFMKYLKDIRATSLKPYLLYNSWYDLRAPEMVKNPINVMNEKNVKRIIESFNRNLVKIHGINLDAFVLDDGWDVYHSDWVLRKKQFPLGLKPISDYLEKTNTSLGIWFGPTGGYSNRDWRLDWMKEHGYEIVGDQLCLAGTKYKKLLKKRVVDLVLNEGVSYYKWDGIQFSCSQPEHGHAIGIYSRRAVMESVIDLCKTVREKDPNIFLNVTSGTWLSPWWVKYANTIWMQGYDYGYADVPSPGRRDRAMTYRDYVLFDGLKKNNLWFPIANLMTHGIIKGDLQKLGGESEPLDKFTDNALLYFARGVTMWELYVSPDLLSRGEWQAIARSIKWAKDRFPILTTTELVGGDPGKRKPYGYIHPGENRIILAARNPFVEPAVLAVGLDSSLGLEKFSGSMVLERTYPTRWISPILVSDSDDIKISLRGYETAVYEIYPLNSSSVPLLADAVFEEVPSQGSQYNIKVLDTGNNLKILNPQKIKNLSCEGKNINVGLLDFEKTLTPPVLNEAEIKINESKKGYQLKLVVEVNQTVKSAKLAILLENETGKREVTLPSVQAVMDGKDLEADLEMQKNRWLWILIDVPQKRHVVDVILSTGKKGKMGLGKISAWIIAEQEYPAVMLSFDCYEKVLLQSMPPRPLPSSILKQIIKLKEYFLNEKSLKGVH